MNRTLTTIAVSALLLIAPACGSEEAADPATGPNPSAPSGGTDPHGSATVTVAGRDYSFDDVPATVAAGTALTLTNSSTHELHELVAFRLPADEDRPLSDLLALPAEELGTVLGAPATVLLRPPGSDEQIVAVGDGVLREPGRYALLCFIPIGADPQEYLDAAAAADGEAPQGVAGGPPHFTSGMSAEVVVEP